MAAKKPHRGDTISIGSTVAGGLPADFKKPPLKGTTKNGLWRPDAQFTRGDGLKVTLRNERGLTDRDVLRVPFRFQVPPTGDFQRPYRVSYSTYDTLRLGQRPRLQGRQLLEISLDTMFLDGPAADGTSGVVVWDAIADPQNMLRELRWVMGERRGSEAQVFRLVISQQAVWGNNTLVDMLAVLTALTPTQKADSVGTEYVSATFLEWPEDMDIDRKRQRPAKNGATTHKLRHDDTLYEIAKKSHFRRASAWQLIAKANGIKGVSPGDDDELRAWAKRHHKTKLKIPAKGSK